jgi:hypothetical protein
MSIDEVIATIPEECIRDLHSSDVTYIAEQVSHKLLSFYYTLNIEKLHEKAVRKEEENKRRRERSRQKREEHFRASLRHLEPRLGPNATWEEVRPRVENKSSFLAIETEEERIAIFEQYINKLKAAPTSDAD